MPVLWVLLALLLSGCGDEPRGLSDADVDRIAQATARKVMDQLVEKGSDDLASRLHTKLRDLDRVTGTRGPAPSAVEPSPAPIAATPVPLPPFPPMVATAGPPPSPLPALVNAAASPASSADVSVPPLLPLAAATAAPAPPGPGLVASLAPAAGALPSPMTTGDDPVVLELEGIVLRASQVLALARQKGYGGTAEAGPAFLRDLADFELTAAMARRAKLLDVPQVKARIEAVRRDYAGAVVIRDLISAIPPVADADLRARYNQQLPAFTDRERAEVEEIHSASKEDLQKAMEALDRGEDLAVAQKAGKVPASVRSSGRIAAQPGQYPVETYRALKGATKGKCLPASAVNGTWLSIRLLAFRPESVVPFEQVKDALKRQMDHDQAVAALADRESQARVKIPVTSHPEGLKSTQSLAVIAEVGDTKVLRQDLLRELAGIPANFRSRYQNPEGFAELAQRYVQRVVLGAHALQHDADFVTRHGLDLDELVKQELVRTFLEQEVASKVDVAEADIKARYESEKESKYAGEQVRLRNISFRVTKPTEQAEAVKRANKAMDRLKSGAAFETVARDLSEDRDTAIRGGDMGWLRPDQLLPGLRDEVARLKPGATSLAPVMTSQGFHLIRLEGRRTHRAYEEVASELETALRAQRQQSLFVQKVAEWKKLIEVRVHGDRMKWPAATVPAPTPSVTSMATAAPTRK